MVACPPRRRRVVTVMGEETHEGALALAARAFAEAGMDGDDALVVSARAGGLRRAVNVCRAHPKVAVLTGPGAGPAELGRALHPQAPRVFVVCEGLRGPDGRATRVRPAEATTRPWDDPDVVIVHDPRWRREPPAGIRTGPAGWALPEEAFERGDGPLPGAGTRALALARLGPRLGDLVWDVGAGAGAVGIECARLGAAVIAVDRDERSCDLVRRNVRAHGVKLAVCRGPAPQVLAHLPDPDAVFVGGGGPPVIEECARRALRAVVAVLGEPDQAGEALRTLRDAGYAAEAVALAVSGTDRPEALAEEVRRPGGRESVFVVSGVRSS